MKLKLVKEQNKGRKELIDREKLEDSVDWISFFFKHFLGLLFKKSLFIYLFLAALGLRCCTQAFSGCGERELLFVAVCGLLITVASLVAKHGP